MAIQYLPTPPPQGNEGLALYLNKELLRIGAFIAEITEVFGGNMYGSTAGLTQAVTTNFSPITQFDSTTVANGVLVEPASAKFTIQHTGIYLVSFAVTMSSSSNNTSVSIGISEGGATPIAASIATEQLKQAGDFHQVSATFLVEAPVGSTAELEIKADSNVTMTYDALIFNIVEQT